jgi:hypothetical protein
VSRRARIRAYGSAGLTIVAGTVCAVAVGGGLGDVLALALVGIGLVVITSLAFLEVGLSEDRARGIEQRRARDTAEQRRVRDTERRRGREYRSAPRASVPRPDRRVRGGPLGRMRGQRRKLR